MEAKLFVLEGYKAETEHHSCFHEVDASEIPLLLKKMETAFQALNDPMVSSFPMTELERVNSLLQELRSIYIKTRPKSKMMESQNL
jgi:hypothetical protein